MDARIKPASGASAHAVTGLVAPKCGRSGCSSRPSGTASRAAKMMPPNAKAARIAPCRQPASATAAINKIARIQMVMHLLKIIPPKMHDENDGQLLVVDGVALRHCLPAERAPEKI